MGHGRGGCAELRRSRSPSSFPIFNEAPNIPALLRAPAAGARRVGPRCEVICTSTTAAATTRWRCCAAIAERDARVGVIELTPQLRPARRRARRASPPPRRASSSRSTAICRTRPRRSRACVGQIDEGYDVVGDVAREPPRSVAAPRARRRWSTAPPRRPSACRMRDYGCMLRAYRREIVEQIVDCDERSLFIPALANSLARRTGRDRGGDTPSAPAGSSKYGRSS